MGTVKDRYSKDLIEVEEIKVRCKNTEELREKSLNDTDKHSGMVTHLEPDILECAIKWTLGSIATNKASTGDGIPSELFKFQKRML